MQQSIQKRQLLQSSAAATATAVSNAYQAAKECSDAADQATSVATASASASSAGGMQATLLHTHILLQLGKGYSEMLTVQSLLGPVVSRLP